MKLLLQSWNGEYTISFTNRKTTTIATIKTLLIDHYKQSCVEDGTRMLRNHLDSNALTLRFDSKKLDDERSLAYYGIKQGSVIVATRAKDEALEEKREKERKRAERKKEKEESAQREMSELLERQVEEEAEKEAALEYHPLTEEEKNSRDEAIIREAQAGDFGDMWRLGDMVIPFNEHIAGQEQAGHLEGMWPSGDMFTLPNQEIAGQVQVGNSGNLWQSGGIVTSPHEEITGQAGAGNLENLWQSGDPTILPHEGIAGQQQPADLEDIWRSGDVVISPDGDGEMFDIWIDDPYLDPDENKENWDPRVLSLMSL
ncbi:hypothetical protein ACLMJK_006083 [Lecanora helva]